MRRKSVPKKIQKPPNPAICPSCKKIVKTPPKLDPYYSAFRKWKCEHCAIVWAENFPKGRCHKFGIINQDRCRKCGAGIVANMKTQNCPYFDQILRPPVKWMQKAWEKS